MSQTQIFTPAGGMNQDDSTLTPTPNAAGRNAFGLGDYRYALNTKIGCSKSDNFGDVETLKGTTEVTDYWVRSVINTNPLFASGLTGWSQINTGTDWTLSGSDVVTAFAAGSNVSDIIYQAVAPSQRRIGIRIKVSVGAFISNSAGYIIFLDGTTEISRQQVINDVTSGLAVNNVYAKYVNVELPADCDGVGFQIVGSSFIGSNIQIQAFQFYDWIAGSRPAGVEKVIGKLENKELNQFFYYVYNDAGNHCIRYYDPSVGRIYELLKWSGLNFGSQYFISGDMVDNWLGFTDRNNSPRLIDVYTISDLFLILGSDFREYHLSFHRWAPVMPPTIAGYYDGLVNNYKRFEGKSMQFAYRYIYQGHLKSRFSPVSNTAQNFLSIAGNEMTSIELFIPGFSLDVPGAATQYNYFNNENIKFTSFVDQIEIAYRESSIDLWRTMLVYNVKFSGNQTFRYDGGTPPTAGILQYGADSTPIVENDFTQLFDVVPFRCGTIAAIDSRFVFADILDENDVAPQPQVTNVGVVKFDASQTLFNWWNTGSNDAGDNAILFSGCSAGDADQLGHRNYISDTTFKGRGLYKLGIQWLSETGWRSAIYTTDNWIYEIPEETGIIDKMYALTFKFPTSFKPPSWAVAYQVVRTNVLNIDYFMFGAVNSFTPLIDDNTYTDNTEVPEALRNRIRQHFEDARTVAGLTKELGNVLRGKPFYKSVVSDVRKTSVVALASVADASRLSIDVNNWYNASKKNSGGTQNNPVNKLFYNYRDGDRVRFLASTTASPTASQKVIYDVPILEFSGRVIIVEKPDGIAWLPGLTTTVDTDYLIEVYTPKTPSNQEDYLYHEVGDWYPVLYPGTDQRDMSKRDWTFTLTNAVTCTTYGDFRVYEKLPFHGGDCSAILKTFYFNIQTLPLNDVSVSAYTSSMNPDPNKTFDRWEKNNGRAYPAYTDFPIVKFKGTQVRFSGQAVEESFVNNINRVREEDQKIYPSEYGRIRMMVNTANAQVESVGAILLAIGERETFSIYVNRTTLEDLSGSTSVGLSDRVLGSYNTLLGSHGTLNPESVTLFRGNVYYWDASDGEWIRYGRDGLTEISRYKMRTWFKGIAELIRSAYQTSEIPVVISEFDPFSEVLHTYINHSTLPESFRDYTTYKGSVFSEDDKRWKECHSYTPEMFGKMDDQLLSFKAGSLFKHEVSNVYSTFYGTKYDVMIEPVFNEIPKNVKTWTNLSITASHRWSAERILSEYRGAKAKRLSSIAMDQFQNQEDRYDAAIKNDQNTPIVANPLISGDTMKAHAIKVLLKLDPAVVDLSLLYYVEAGQIDSPKNP